MLFQLPEKYIYKFINNLLITSPQASSIARSLLNFIKIPI